MEYFYHRYPSMLENLFLLDSLTVRLPTTDGWARHILPAQTLSCAFNYYRTSIVDKFYNRTNQFQWFCKTVKLTVKSIVKCKK